MKKFLSVFLGAIILLSACKKKDEYIFDKSPDERINETLTKFQTLLTSAENGWKGYIKVNKGDGAIYSFYFNFNADNRVTMVSDFDSASAVTLQESSYRLRQQQQPTLIFDTYSYVHVLADPNEENAGVVAHPNNGPVGQGLLSDFEFIIDQDSISAGAIKMVGKVNGATLTLIRASKAEADIFRGGQWNTNNFVAKNFDKILTYYKRLNIGGVLYDVKFDNSNLQRKIIFSWLDGAGKLQTFSTDYFNTTNGIVLFTALQNGSQNISSISIDNWNSGTNTLTINSGTVQGSLTETILPLKVDTAAPLSWYKYPIARGGYWASWDGFHVNGVDDGFKVNALKNYYYLIYWPDDVSGDFFAPIFLNAAGTDFAPISYAFFPQATFGSNGITVFTSLGNYGTYPSTGGAALSKAQLLQPEGYYFVQTSETTYDMVSAKDGKTWINWFF